MRCSSHLTVPAPIGAFTELFATKAGDDKRKVWVSFVPLGEDHYPYFPSTNVGRL